MIKNKIIKMRFNIIRALFPKKYKYIAEYWPIIKIKNGRITIRKLLSRKTIEVKTIKKTRLFYQ
jgi:hypothetical protein